MSIVSTKYGRMRIIDSDPVVSRALALYGEWAIDELSLLARIISPGMCVLDVGAFIGTHSLAFSELVGHKGIVYSFEPRKEIYTILSENLSINNCKNVTAINIGLAEKDKNLNLESLDINNNINFGGLSLDCHSYTPNSDTYQIHVSTIDGLGIDKIDVIKLDVEGMERSVLDGAEKTILRDRPIVFCECNSMNAGYEILEFCQTRQYDTYGFMASAYNPNNFNAIKENIFGGARELGLFLFPREKTEETITRMVGVPLLPINNLEDLILPLLHKPQYAYEVLANTATYAALGINFPSPAIANLEGQIVSLNQTIGDRDEQIAILQQRQNELQVLSNELRNEIEALRLSTSWQITKPLRKVSQWGKQFMRLFSIYLNYRKIYPGFVGFQRLSRQCVDAVQNGGVKGLRSKVSLHECITHGAPALENAKAREYSANQINLLSTYIDKGLIVTPTIIFDHNGGGGSNLYTDKLIKDINANGGAILRVYCFDAVWFVQWIGDGMLFNTYSIEELFEVLSTSCSKNIIINSVYGYPDVEVAIANIITLAKIQNATLDYKMHDFYALCPSPHLSDFEDKYCGVPQDVEVCRLCLKKNHNWYHSWFPNENKPIDIIIWRQPFAALFEVATTVSIFDSSAVEILGKAFSIDESKIKIVPHETNYFKCDKQIELSASLHIGVLGALSVPKGGAIVSALYHYFDKQKLNIPLTIVGSSYVATHQKITVHGNYTPHDLPIIISKAGINVILMPSIIPETFSYTISEAMKMGLPIVTFDLGAQGNRVKQYELGKVIPLGSSPEAILTAIQSVLKVAQEFKN